MPHPATLPALLIVDVQRGFINEYTKHIPALVQALQHDYPNVFATRFYNPAGSNYRKLLKWNRFSVGSRDTELAFEPTKNVQIIDKPHYTCISQEFLANLDRLGVNEVHVCGIDTDVCVTKSAVDLFEAGYTPVVLEGFSASHAGPAAHDAAIATLRRFIGKTQVISRGGAGAP